MLQKLDNPTSQCNLKFVSEVKGEFEGYASVFNSDDLVGDTIKKGAFQKSLSGNTPKMFVNHDHYSIPVGSWVKAFEDDHGLFVHGSINMEHRDGPSAYSAMKRGDMEGLSIGFTMGRDDYQEKSGGGRIITNMMLKEVSIVTFPCEPKAIITTVKSMEEIESIRDLERFIRDEFAASKSVACSFLSHAKRILSGDLTEAEKRITELEKQLQRKNAVESLFNAIERIGV